MASMGLGLSKDGYVKLIIEMFTVDVNMMNKMVATMFEFRRLKF